WRRTRPKRCSTRCSSASSASGASAVFTAATPLTYQGWFSAAGTGAERYHGDRRGKRRLRPSVTGTGEVGAEPEQDHAAASLDGVIALATYETAKWCHARGGRRRRLRDDFLPTRENRLVHRWCQSLCRGARAAVRHRLQAAPRPVRFQG